ncbi:MAG: hypothetical protein KGH73_07775 [Xanthomonadaceae bacterium]|nr:hypothetical protein [Xanthomonadaceae bacterium]
MEAGAGAAVEAAAGAAVEAAAGAAVVAGAGASAGAEAAGAGVSADCSLWLHAASRPTSDAARTVRVNFIVFLLMPWNANMVAPILERVHWARARVQQNQPAAGAFSMRL